MGVEPFLPGCKTHSLCPGLPPHMSLHAASDHRELEKFQKEENSIRSLAHFLVFCLP